MRYIEENFINHETYLGEQEIDVLKEFIERIKNNLLVEGVYITPIHYEENYRYDEFDKVMIDIKIVINDTPTYNMMTYKEELPNKEYNLKIIEEIKEDFNKQMGMINNKINDYEIRYHLGESIDYTIEPEITFQELCNEELINSYIIFDRYDYFSNLLDELKEKNFIPSPLIVKIINIDELDKSFVKKKFDLNELIII